MVGFVDGRQQIGETRVLVDRKCALEGGTQYVEVAPGQKAYRNDRFALHLTNPIAVKKTELS